MRLLFRVTRAILKYTAHSHMDLSYCCSTIDQTINALIQLPRRLTDYLNARQKRASKKSNQISNRFPKARIKITFEIVENLNVEIKNSAENFRGILCLKTVVMYMSVMMI